eukprot:3171401-Pleurochrysis_carterae.AAC.1
MKPTTRSCASRTTKLPTSALDESARHGGAPVTQGEWTLSEGGATTAGSSDRERIAGEGRGCADGWTLRLTRAGVRSDGNA